VRIVFTKKMENRTPKTRKYAKHSPTPLSESEKNSFAFPKPKKIVKEKKGLKRVGERKKRRIAEHGTESELFKRIWNEKAPYCIDCGSYIHQMSHHCFHHVKPK
jgi:hypothetical protein